MTDHQQAAIEAAAKQHSPHLWDEQFRDSLLRLRGLTPEIADEAVEKRRAEILAEAEEYITAAEPHLRRKWAAEVREKVNPPDVDYSHEWRRGFTVGAIKAARFVEGAGE